MPPDTDAAISQLMFSRDRMVLILANGHRAKIALSRFPALARALPQQREQWQLHNGGGQVHWPSLSLTLTKQQLLEAR